MKQNCLTILLSCLLLSSVQSAHASLIKNFSFKPNSIGSRITRWFSTNVKKPVLFHKYKIGLGVGALAIGTYLYYNYSKKQNPKTPVDQNLEMKQEQIRVLNEEIKREKEKVNQQEQESEQKESHLKEQLKKKEALLTQLGEIEKLKKQAFDTKNKDDEEKKIDNPQHLTVEKGEKQPREHVEFKLWDVVKLGKSERFVSKFKKDHLGLVTHVNEKQKQISVDFIADDFDQQPKQLVTIKNQPQEFFEKIEMQQGQNENVSLYQEVVLKIKTYQGETVSAIGRVIQENNNNEIIVKVGLNARSISLREMAAKKTDVFVEKNEQQPRSQAEKTSQKQSRKTFEEKLSIFRAHFAEYHKNKNKESKEVLLKMINRLLDTKGIDKKITQELTLAKIELNVSALSANPKVFTDDPD